MSNTLGVLPTRSLVSLATVLALCGCRTSQDVTRPDPRDSAATPAARSQAKPRFDTPIVINPAVPATAAGLLVVRSPDSLFEMLAELSLFGGRAPADDAAFRVSLDAYLARRLGVTLTSASSITVYMSEEPVSVGIILEGFDGELSSPRAELEGLASSTEHPIHTFDLDAELYATTHGHSLLVGTPAALAAMVGTLDGAQPALADTESTLGLLIAEHSAGATMAFAVEAERVPIAEELADEFGIEHLYIDLSDHRTRGLALGSPAAMRELAEMVDVEMRETLDDFDQRRREVANEQDPFTVLAMMTAQYSAQQMAALLTPKLEGGQLSLDIPLDIPQVGAMMSLAGISSLLAIPSFARYGRRAKTAEAKTQIAKLFDACTSFFKEEQRTRGGAHVVRVHACPNDGRASGEAGITPPLALNCNDGPGGRCIPVVGGSSSEGYYDIELWNENPVWNSLNYVQETGHFFHYNFIWANDDSDGYGSCMFTVQAFADLDDDGVFSTYERSGHASMNGINASIGLYIDLELE